MYLKMFYQLSNTEKNISIIVTNSQIFILSLK